VGRAMREPRGPAGASGLGAGARGPAAGASGPGAGAALDPTDRRVGILGGTFDPIHYGHLVIAEQVREALSLDRVLFVPGAVPPHKIGLSITPAEHRAALVELAIAGNPRFAVTRMEFERDGPSYTADTLEILALEAARQGVARDLFFILSTEALAGLPDWRDPDRILSLCRLAVVPRPGTPLPSEAELAARFGDRAGRIVEVATVPLAHSASAVRARAAAGLSIRYLVPPAVEAYICDHRLYRSDNPSEDCPK
jgi:nicotinate-nucleotide adenylyltransferase